MKLFNTKLLVVPIKAEDAWGYEDKEAVKLGEVYLPFKGKVEDTEINLEKGDKVYYQYGSNTKIEDVELVIVNPSNLICQK